jgi:hypothetical protein
MPATVAIPAKQTVRVTAETRASFEQSAKSKTKNVASRRTPVPGVIVADATPFRAGSGEGTMPRRRLQKGGKCFLRNLLGCLPN